MTKPRVIAIVGPTSSGKTALSVWLAKKIGGEIISADSRQVYKGLNIGTGKVTKKEMQGVPHYLIDVANPKKQFSVDDFVKLAERVLSGLIYQSTPKIPIVVGGTGLYIDMLLGRMSYPEVPPNVKLRKQLEKKSAEALYLMLKKLDPRRAANIEKENPRRLVRAIEIAKAIGQSPIINTTSTTNNKYDVLWLGLNPPKEILEKKIKARLRARIKAGMLAEAKNLHQAGLSYKRMDELGLEYRYLAQLLQGHINRPAFEVELARAINNYAKRQVRWFKRNKDIHWIKNQSEALHLTKQFIEQ